jgi:hypothetical protein
MNPNEPGSEPIATGDRREDVHLAPDADQKYKAEFLRHADTRPPPDEQSAAQERGEVGPDTPPVEDVRVAPDTPSVWDARPPSPKSSEPSGESGH